MLMEFPEQWTLLRPGADVFDPVTGNRMASTPTEFAWTGLLQQRLIDTKQDEAETYATAELVLLLEPGLPGGTGRRDVWRFEGPAGVSDIVKVGETVQVRGTPRVRRPARGSRRPAYIAAIVRHSTDLQE